MYVLKDGKAYDSIGLIIFLYLIIWNKQAHNFSTIILYNENVDWLRSVIYMDDIPLENNEIKIFNRISSSYI